MATPRDPRPGEQIQSASSTSQDPFWQSTYNYNRGSLAALMEAIQQVVPPPPKTAPTTQRSKIPAHSNHVRRGQCTHITMIRLHTSQPCQMCNRPASMGWLYTCRQDWLLDHQAATAAKRDDETPSVPNSLDYFEVMACLATSLGMSASVINQIRAGAYTFDEVEKLVAQKEHLLNVIRSREQAALRSTMSALDSRLAVEIAAEVMLARPTRASSKDPAVTARCNYMVCHTCRPFLQDRIFTTLDTIVKGDHPPITESEMDTLPMLHPTVVRTIGMSHLRHFPEASGLFNSTRPESVDMTMQQQDDAHDGGISDTSSTHSSTHSSLGYLYDYHDEGEPGSSYPCPGAGICPVYSRNSGCAYDGGFDDGQRAYNHGFHLNGRGHGGEDDEHTTPDRRHRHYPMDDETDTPGGTMSTASSISLPTPTTTPLTRGTPASELYSVLHAPVGKTSKAATVCGIVSPIQHRLRSSGSVHGFEDELEVALEDDGGVLLTEGAVETGFEDILSQR